MWSLNMRKSHHIGLSLANSTRWRSSETFIVFVVAFSVFTDVLLYGLIVPVLPTALHERVGIPEEDQQRWTSILLALFGASQLALSPLAGYLSDRIQSRWWPFMGGLALLLASVALLCVGTHIAFWIVGRLCHGASGAVVWTVGYAIVIDTVENSQIGRALGYVGMGMMLGTILGPLLGGVIYGTGGYYAVFALAFALAGVDVFLRLVMVEKRHAEEHLQDESVPLDWNQGELQHADNKRRASATSAGSRHPCVDIIPDASHEDRTSSHPTQHGPSRKRHPNALIHLLASGRLWVVIWVYFVIALFLTSMDGVLPSFVRDLFGWSQIGQGLIFIPLAIPHLLEPVAGWINDKYPWTRRYLAGGVLLVSAPLCVLLRLVSSNTLRDKVLLCAFLALLGLCMAVALPPILAEASYVAEEKDGQIALVYGVLTSAYAAGSIAGPLFAGLIRDHSGWGTMSWALGLVVGVSSFLPLVSLGGFLKR